MAASRRRSIFVLSALNEFDYEAALAACAAGEHAAMQGLYEQEGARLLGVVQRIVRDRALAEDIVHDACVNIWTRAASFDPTRGSARGWIYSVTRNLALNAVRDGSREVGVDDDTAAALDARASLEAWHDMADAFAWQASAGRIAHCLEQLEPVRRNCILHAYVDGFSHGEIARQLDAPLGTVKAWIKRSLAALRECMA
ncbi:sigma-70 family RNA polymerase sigma factor [Zoogloea oleivorans]|jgi:RNA polymerase sigma-70 factor (ECF subfamily)|uniref:Sigma-70 family RNA polymerase sigma factor n=1 Tax=Zoogloea oleivorans TaxID=1552750 RepID=A0A6C2D602_9RHOO|nr:sigma-70 family RNA polymerase sigma factor [Zoogloea oleivorans]